MIQNRILRFFFIQKWFGTEFWGFDHPKMVWNAIPWVFHFGEMVRNGILFWGFFSSEKWFRTKFREFSFPRNGLEGNSEVFLFCKTGRIPMELLSVPSCCQKMATLIHGESWLPVVNKLGILTTCSRLLGILWTSASEQVYKKVFDDKRPGVQTPQCINNRGLLTTCQQVLL
jgi:hypothetical protein